MKVDRRRHNLLVVDDALDPADLDRLSLIAAHATYSAQDLNRGAFTARKRAVVEDAWIPELLWEALKSHLGPPSDWFGGPGAPRLTPPIEHWRFTGCNSRSRLYSYGMGGTFSEHEDERWSKGSWILWQPVDGENNC